MAEVDRALAKLRTAARRWAASVEREQREREARDDAIRTAGAAGATWTQLQEFGEVSRMTVSKAIGQKRS